MKTTPTERAAILATAKELVTLAGDGSIEDEHRDRDLLKAACPGLSDVQAREFVAKAARVLRGEIVYDVGRRAAMDGGRSITVYLSAELAAKAEAAGAGNASAGVRMALAAYQV